MSNNLTGICRCGHVHHGWNACAEPGCPCIEFVPTALAQQTVDIEVQAIDLRVGNVEIVGPDWTNCTIKVSGVEIEALSLKLTCSWNKGEPMRLLLELPVEPSQ